MAAKRLGVGRVASALGLCFASLRRRATGEARAGVSRGKRNVAPAGFLEVTGAQVLAPSGGMGGAGAVVEFFNRKGERLTITLPPASALDVSGLISSLRA